MDATALSLLKRSLADADEVRTLPKTRIERVTLDQHTVIRVTFEPGWKWSECVGPAVEADFCETPHFGVCIGGQLRVHTRDGQELDMHAGDVMRVPPGHDSWVVGDEPFVCIDFTAGDNFAR